VAPRWTGKCAGCGEWNTLLEETGAPQPGTGLARASRGRAVALEDLAQGHDEVPRRIPTGLAELDRVTGGGIVPGSALLIGGEPGIGKSTLLLQVAAALASAGRRAVYFTGEEAATQVRLRAERLGLAGAPVALAAETSLSNILATLAESRPPDLVIVDSIQTLWADGIEAAAGTVSQVRAATQSLIRLAKAQGPALLLVGHVTKDGQIAGPKVIEHMVDTVLYFEGDRGHAFRILRAVKNRFGATDEIGVFEMSPSGLVEVANPSELFLGERLAATAGSAVFAGMEGTRPLLVELQALVVPSGLGTPRRAVVGWDANRLAMLLAVLDARAGIGFSQHDVYLNVAGGLKIAEPAADLAAAAALLSSISNVALGPHEVYFGEIGLSGAVRPAGHMAARLKEAGKLGFRRATLPAAGDLDDVALKLDLFRLTHVRGLADALGL
jgi:DNA repair protein RadA/Sms